MVIPLMDLIISQGVWKEVQFLSEQQSQLPACCHRLKFDSRTYCNSVLEVVVITEYNEHRAMRTWWTVCAFVLKSQISQTGWQHKKSSRAKAGIRARFASGWLINTYLMPCIVWATICKEAPKCQLFLPLSCLHTVSHEAFWQVILRDLRSIHFSCDLFFLQQQCLNKTNYSPSKWNPFSCTVFHGFRTGSRFVVYTLKEANNQL